MRLNQKLRRLKKKQPKISARGGNGLPQLANTYDLDNDDAIARCMEEFDRALNGRDDGAAKAHRERLQRRLRLRRQQLKRKGMEDMARAEVELQEAQSNTETVRLLQDMSATDAQEDAAVRSMEEDDVDDLYDQLVEEARAAAAAGQAGLSTEKERLRRKLERRRRERELKARAAQQMASCDGGGDKVEAVLQQQRIQRDLQADIDRLNQGAASDREFFKRQFESDQQTQSERLRERMRRKHAAKLAAHDKGIKALEEQVEQDTRAVDEMGSGDHSEMLKLQRKIAALEAEAQRGQDDLDALIEANAADSRQLLSNALAGQEKMHSALQQRLLERKRKRKEREALGDVVAGKNDVTTVGGVRGSLVAMRNRNKLKAAAAKLAEARRSVAQMKEHVALKKGVEGVADLREARWQNEDNEMAALGMAELDAQQQAKLRELELRKEAEEEHARMKAISDAHLQVELDEIYDRNQRDAESLRHQMETERQQHSNLLQDRIKRRA